MTPIKKKQSKVSLKRQHSPSEDTIAGALLEIFGVNPYYSQARMVRKEVTYSPIKTALTEQVLQGHLKGEVIAGAYQLQQGTNLVNWFGWDVDSTDREKAKEFATKIITRIAHIPHAVEFSGSKGYHILIFPDKPMPAIQAKHIVDFVRDAEELPKTGAHHVECFPKQAKLTKSQPMGSLLKIPLGEHPKTHDASRFIDIFNGWEQGDNLDPLPILQNKAPTTILLALLKEGADIQGQMVELLTPAWVATPGEHHNFALYLSGYLAHIGWGLEEAKSLVEEIANKAGDEEVTNRVQAVVDTFRNVTNGRTVKGFSGLAELLPGGVVNGLSQLATQAVTPTLVKRIDAVRLQKGAAFTKVRATANLIWAHLNEEGEVVQTTDHIPYWFEHQHKHLIPFDSVLWRAILHQQYGLNPADSFGSQTTEAVKLRAISDARTVIVRNKTHWTGEKLFVNLGNSSVFILDGDSIEHSYNGECGYLFRTDPELQIVIAPDFEKPIDVWGHLVDDISFNKSENAPATPEEQMELLKAWILAFFFQEVMPTKPLLLAMGPPGSGKTSAMRRIMKVLESPSAEVLEVAGDKPDSLRSSIASHRLLVLDNLEKSGNKWLVDTLNRLSTGANIEIRQLYKTNDTYVIKPDCFVAMTAVSMPFSEETLFSRILPLEMAQLLDPLPEYKLQKELSDNLNGIWADLLNKLNAVVKSLLKNNQQVPPIASRLADFTVFCKRIDDSKVVDGTTLIKGLRSLVDRQKLALLNSSPFVAVLEEWMGATEGEADVFCTFSDLYNTLEPLARARKLNWRWSNAAALQRHIQAMAEPLKKLYRMEMKDTKDDLTGRDITVLRFPEA